MENKEIIEGEKGNKWCCKCKNYKKINKENPFYYFLDLRLNICKDCFEEEQRTGEKWLEEQEKTTIEVTL